MNDKTILFIEFLIIFIIGMAIALYLASLLLVNEPANIINSSALNNVICN